MLYYIILYYTYMVNLVKSPNIDQSSLHVLHSSLLARLRTMHSRCCQRIHRRLRKTQRSRTEMSRNVGKTIINHSPVSTILIGGM